MTIKEAKNLIAATCKTHDDACATCPLHSICVISHNYPYSTKNMITVYIKMFASDCVVNQS